MVWTKLGGGWRNRFDEDVEEKNKISVRLDGEDYDNLPGTYYVPDFRQRTLEYGTDFLDLEINSPDYGTAVAAYYAIWQKYYDVNLFGASEEGGAPSYSNRWIAHHHDVVDPPGFYGEVESRSVIRYSYLNTTVPTYYNHQAEFFAYSQIDGIDSEPYQTITEFPGEDEAYLLTDLSFCSIDGIMQWRKWKRFGTEGPSNDDFVIKKLGAIECPEVTTDAPNNNAILSNQNCIIADQCIILRWNVSGGFSYIA